LIAVPEHGVGNAEHGIVPPIVSRNLVFVRCTSIIAGGVNPDTFGAEAATAFPNFKFYDGRHGGYSAATLTKDSWTTDFIVVDNMEDPISGVTKIATVVTEAGSPGAQPA
jgi:alkaline phosphatase D